VSTRRGVAILDAGEGEDLLSDRGGDEASSARGGDEPDTDGSALSVDLRRDGVGHTVHPSPVSTTDRDNVELGNDDGTANSVGNLTGALDTESDVSAIVSDSDESLEAGALSSRRLLLDRHDPHDLVVELSSKEVVDNLGLLDRDGVKEDLLDGVNPSVLYETSKLGDRGPLLLVPVSTVSASTPPSTATTASPSESSAFSFSRHNISSLKLFCVGCEGRGEDKREKIGTDERVRRVKSRYRVREKATIRTREDELCAVSEKKHWTEREAHINSV